MPADGANIDSVAIVQAFIAAINKRDVDGLASLMTDDHTFIDPRGNRCEGRQAMIEGWRGFFGMFPKFHIAVESIGGTGDFVAVFGRSACAYAGKRGSEANTFEMPAAWKAVVCGGKIQFWQVFADWTEGARLMEEDSKS